VTATTTDRHVTVRMYNVGFGDAFLILFPGQERAHRVLVDCGMHFMGKGPRSMSEVVEQIVDDVTDEDGKARIDVVVGTHRHQDHVSGFELKAWADVEVGEVWMPWTEHPKDPLAREIREKQSSTAKRLEHGLLALGKDENAPEVQLAQNALTNAKAMATLHSGFARPAPRRFLPRKRSRVMRPPGLPGVRVHALGPRHDAEVIRDMNPPAGESYLWLSGATPAAQEPVTRAPFTPDWALPISRFERSYGDLALGDRLRRRFDDYATIDPLALAVKLEAAVNGTSLVLAFEVGKALLLFPGDAQWGTWDAMLRDPATLALLERTTFLKVGHHGSHNATPIDFVEALKAARDGDTPPEAWAMVSTRTMEKWPEIPRAPLLEALEPIVAAKLARSDKGADAREGFTKHTKTLVEARVPID
jgi:beta-lactamase superfamily II metal-dependent hydrolase